MTGIGYFVRFLAGILGYAALLYRVMNRRPRATLDFCHDLGWRDCAEH